MAKFTDEAVVVETDPNKEALAKLGVRITIIDKETKKEHTFEDEDIIRALFKERKGHVFLRLKGKNGLYVSIPKEKVPRFIKITEEKKNIW
jgi:hypothetical protein